MNVTCENRMMCDKSCESASVCKEKTVDNPNCAEDNMFKVMRDCVKNEGNVGRKSDVSVKINKCGVKLNVKVSKNVKERVQEIEGNGVKVIPDCSAKQNVKRFSGKLSSIRRISTTIKIKTPKKEEITPTKKRLLEEKIVKKKTFVYENKKNVILDCPIASLDCGKVCDMTTQKTPLPLHLQEISVSEKIVQHFVTVGKTTSTTKCLSLNKEDIQEDNQPSPAIEKECLATNVSRSPGPLATSLKKKTAHARGEGVKKRKLLEETARNLKLPSLKKYFISTDKICKGEKEKLNSYVNETLQETRGVSWAGTSQVRYGNTDCADQSEGGTELDMCWRT